MQKQKKGFLKILQRYMDNTAASDEKRVMDFWYESIDNEVGEPDVLSRKNLEEKIWLKIKSETTGGKVPHVPVRRKWWESSVLKMASAAAVLFVVGFIYYTSDYRKLASFPVKGISAETFASLSQTENNTTANRLVQLRDGSKVTLDPGASLYYPENFASDKRVVYLVGNGFFDIAKNLEKPFLVYSEDIVTKVVGTSFTIRKDKISGNVEVAVVTGKVIVEKSAQSKADFKPGAEGVVLTPNKKVIYLAESEQYVTGLVENPVLVQHQEEYVKPEAFNFEEAPLSAVIEKLEKAYGVEIEVANKSILNCPITADLTQESLFPKLEIINALLNTKSAVEGTSVILSGGECAPFKSVHANP